MPKNQGATVARIILPLVGLLFWVACGGSPEPAADAKPRIIATTGMIADMAQRIAGDEAQVEALMQPGIDPHLFKASESDVRRLAEADLILYNGLHLEGKMGDVLKKMSRSRPVVAVAEVIAPDALREPPGLPGQYDPHIWFDIVLWRATLAPIRQALSDLLPDHATAFEARAAALDGELAALHGWVEETLARLPEERRILVTAHDAFGYFGARYGIEVIGLQGISTLSEAGLQDVERVVDRVVEEKIPAIFVESSVPQRSIEAVQAAVAARGHRVTIGGALFSDSMGPAGTPEGTYLGMVRHNVGTFVDAMSPANQEATP
ncbi:MAG: zinc ABC transporter substrate-binding protein [Acidobacteriota bacterium]